MKYVPANTSLNVDIRICVREQGLSLCGLLDTVARRPSVCTTGHACSTPGADLVSQAVHHPGGSKLKANSRQITAAVEDSIWQSVRW